MQELLELAFDDPGLAVQTSERLLAQDSDPTRRSFAHQCLGIVSREAGETDLAMVHLEAALEEAVASRDDSRARDVRATYAGTLVFAGETARGLAQFDVAAEGATGSVAGKVLARKATVLTHLGRYAEAVVDLVVALGHLELAGDRLWEARTRNLLAHLHLRAGELGQAEEQLERARAVLVDLGALTEVAESLETRAEVAIARGDMPSALGHLDAAARVYRNAGLEPRLEHVRCHAGALLAAGLNEEAVVLLEATAEGRPLSPLHSADVRLALGRALLASGLRHRAVDVSRRAASLYEEQGRTWFEHRSRLVLLTALAQLGSGDGLAIEAVRVADALDADGADEAAEALVLAGRMSTDAAVRAALWNRGGAYRSHPNGMVRASANLARSYLRAELDDRGGVLRACAAGLDAIDEHRRLMGSSELRALATTHGRELTEIALRHAAHDPRTLLRWSERTRATALAQPPATSDAATIPASLAALRDNGRRLAEARQAGESTEDLVKERLRLERAVRTEAHTVSADGDPQRPASAEEVVAGVGDGCLVELVDVDGVLHVLVVHQGRVRRRVAGTTAAVADLLGPTTMLLRRAARGRAANTDDLGRRLEETILGDAVRLVPDGPLILAPTARLHGLAWALLPTLHDRPFNVVPSAGQWLRATATERPDPRRTLLVAGPNLESGGAEVPILASRHPDATLLGGPAAKLADVLNALDGADLAHLATHGRFRADSPLFSALDLADGPLTVHDLERLRRAPYRVVLSACESGVLAPVGAQELLGLAAALFSLGTAGLVSSVGEVNDAATADLMVGLHDGLARGDDPATALHAVRRAAAEDPVAAGTAAAFVALGV